MSTTGWRPFRRAHVGGDVELELQHLAAGGVGVRRRSGAAFGPADVGESGRGSRRCRTCRPAASGERRTLLRVVGVADELQEHFVEQVAAGGGVGVVAAAFAVAILAAFSLCLAAMMNAVPIMRNSTSRLSTTSRSTPRRVRARGARREARVARVDGADDASRSSRLAPRNLLSVSSEHGQSLS